MIKNGRPDFNRQLILIEPAPTDQPDGQQLKAEIKELVSKNS